MSRLKPFYISLCMVAMACAAEATSPTLSISLVLPATLRVSWDSNFADWQLKSTTNLSSANWQAVAQTPVSSNNALVVLFPLSNKSGYFRLEPIGGGCLFQATPPVIMSGASSILGWCPVTGLTYQVSPGPGVVAGGSLIVSPTVTTVYTLTASNALGVVTNFATVIVNPCGFASVSNWDATLNFSYTLAPSAPDFNFIINRQAQATFRLTPFGNGVFAFNGSASGLASINDREDDSSSGSLITSTTVGFGAPVPLLSTFVLGINCMSNLYNFSAIVAVDAIDTETGSGGSSSFARPAIAGQVAVLPRPLPVASSTISGSAVLPVMGPFTIPTTDYYTPNDVIANDMWINGVITDATAGTASVSWSLTPAP